MALTTLSELIEQLDACTEPEQVNEPPASRPVSQVEYKAAPENFVLICGSTLAIRCRAKSKRSKRRCKQPAMKSKFVCRYHGGKSTGPRTAAGRKHCAEARTVHGRETRAIRKQSSQKSREMRILMRVAKEHGLIR